MSDTSPPTAPGAPAAHLTARIAARRVQRPVVLGLVAAIAFGAAAVAGVGLFGMQAALLAGPVTLVSDTDEIADALADSPWAGSAGTGPIVWAFTRPDCSDCGKLDAAAIAALAEEEMEIRMVVVAPRGVGDATPDAAPSSLHAIAASLAQSRDWTQMQRWSDGQAPIAFSGDRLSTDGYVEWGRASYDRIAAILRDNGVDPKLPLLIWRRGPEWRVLVGGRAVTLDAVRRDMAVES